MADQNPCIMIVVIALGIILAIVILGLCCCPSGGESPAYSPWPGL